MSQKITLTPHKDAVQIIESPPDADFLEVYKVLKQEKPSITDMANLRLRGLVPFCFKTDLVVDGGETAILKVVPQDLEPLPSGKGWSWSGQSTRASAFRKRGKHKNAPLAEGITGCAAGNNRFVVV